MKRERARRAASVTRGEVATRGNAKRDPQAPSPAAGVSTATRRAMASPSKITHNDALALQRVAGNRRAAALLDATAAPAVRRAPAGTVQRVTLRDMFLEYGDDVEQLGAFSRWLGFRAGDKDVDREKLLSMMSREEVTGSIALFVEHEREEAAVQSISIDDVASGRAELPETPGKQIDTLMLSSPHIGAIAAEKYAHGVKVEGEVEVLGDDEFQRKHWESFSDLNRRQLEDQSADVIRHFQLRDASKIDRVDGFQCDMDGKIYMRPGRLGFRIAVHEAVHKYGGSAFMAGLGNPLNEGATDYIAMIVCAQIGAEIGTQYYPREKRLLDEVLRALDISDDELFDAYFNSRVEKIMGRLIDRIGPNHAYRFRKAKTVPEAVAAFNEGQRR